MAFHAGRYDSALDKMTTQMREMMDAIQEEAAFRGMEAADYSPMWTTLKGALATMEQWKGFYAPRIRQGNWAVRATRGKEVYREHRGSEYAAQRLGKQLQSENWKRQLKNCISVSNWDDTRRKFDEATYSQTEETTDILARIDQIYHEVEPPCKEMTDEHHRLFRQEHSVMILTGLFS
jgi:hypothetical protein